MAVTAQTYNVPNGSIAPDFNFTGIDGQWYHLYAITAQDKYVMLDFTQATCPPCMASAEAFAKLYELYGCNAHELVCVAVNGIAGQGGAVMHAYHAAKGGGWAEPPAIVEAAGGWDLSIAYGVGSAPTFYLIGPDNRMINNGIWPVVGLESFAAAFPAGHKMDVHPCSSAVGVPEQEQPTVCLFPNPAEERITLCHGNARSYRILDVQGRLCAQGALVAGSAVVSGLHPGVHIVEFDGRWRSRFVKI
ncbi:MAG: TlpA family protein disulfide reductase [Flavobacteriales bacterium]|nr:TlpA family protein disulfide reductase [Flavobacteriales bacterium]